MRSFFQESKYSITPCVVVGVSVFLLRGDNSVYLCVRREQQDCIEWSANNLFGEFKSNKQQSELDCCPCCESIASIGSLVCFSPTHSAAVPSHRSSVNVCVLVCTPSKCCSAISIEYGIQTTAESYLLKTINRILENWTRQRNSSEKRHLLNNISWKEIYTDRHSHWAPREYTKKYLGFGHIGAGSQTIHTTSSRIVEGIKWMNKVVYHIPFGCDFFLLRSLSSCDAIASLRYTIIYESPPCTPRAIYGSDLA